MIDARPLLDTTHSTPLKTGLAGAITLARPLGLALNARYQHTFGDRGPLTIEDAFVGAAALDFDFGRISAVPVGLLAAYQVIVPFNAEDRDQLWHYLDAGVYYTGRDQLVLGLQVGLRRFPQRARITSEGAIGQVVSRYYW
jgi:hypothetical protein